MVTISVSGEVRKGMSSMGISAEEILKLQSEDKALKQIVERLLESVKDNEKKLGYIYWRHN
jgi:hypothetical protein